MAKIKRTISKSEADHAKSVLNTYYSQKAKETGKKVSASAKKYGSKAASATKSGAKSLGSKISKFLTSK